MCDKKSIRELREEAELKKMWKKTNDIVDKVKTDTTTDILGRRWKKQKPEESEEGTKFIEENFR